MRDRRLIWHGVVQFTLGLVIGAAVPVFANPRMALSAHVGTLMVGTFVAVVGMVWHHVTLPPAHEAAAFWLLLFGSYVTAGALVLAASFGTSALTPIAGAGHRAAPWQELITNAAFVSSSLAVLIACGLLVLGLRPPHR